VSGSVVLSRAALDAALVEAAVEAGVEVCTGWSGSLGALEDDRRRVLLTGAGSRRTVAARVVVDATGLGGMRRTPEAGPGPVESVARTSRIGVGAVYPSGSLPGACAPGTVEMAVGPSGYVGFARQEDGSFAVAGALEVPWVRRWGGPGPAVMELLDRAEVTPPRGEPSIGWKGTLPLTRARARRGETRVFTVGDAAGYVEPFTGEGMSWALLSALELAPLAHDAVAAWTPTLVTAWDRRYARRVGRRQRVCRGVAWLSRRRRLTVAALTVLGRVPGLAAPLIPSPGALP
jgi:flavin-dependent dehydrogenase